MLSISSFGHPSEIVRQRPDIKPFLAEGFENRIHNFIVNLSTCDDYTSFLAIVKTSVNGLKYESAVYANVKGQLPPAKCSRSEVAQIFLDSTKK
jgi:hypothetical protein